MKRRSFIQSGSIISLPMMVNGLNIAAITKSKLFNLINEDNDKILVLIQLNGGNDGLNTLIPMDQYAELFSVRQNIIIPENQLLSIEGENAFHPAMGAFQEMYNQSKLNIIQSAGYPNQNRSHFRSTDIWTTASPAEEFWTTGWLGRYFNLNHPGYPEGYPNVENPDPLAITIGYTVSETCQGPVSNYSLALTDPDSLGIIAEQEEGELEDNCYGYELKFVQDSIKQANAYSSAVTAAAEAGTNLSTKYDDNNRLALQLKTVARLINGGLKTKIYVVTLGGFDTHANQVNNGNPSQGGHAQLLGWLSDAIDAFQDDVELMGKEEKVLGMTFSEFGRRIRANESLGTDHGTAAPLFVFGTCVNGTILGDNPEISTNVGVQEGVPMQFDFRSIYGSILMDWFEVAENDVRNLLYEDFQHIPIIEGCAPTYTQDIFDAALDFDVFPNPFSSNVQVKFTAKSERVRLSLFDVLGNELRVIFDRKLSAGDHRFNVDTSKLTPGNYVMRLVSESGQKTKLINKAF
jgi:uncharacterized protein (DUF1501 family)